MHKESQESFFTTYENRLSIRMPMQTKIKFLNRCNELDLSPAELLGYLLEFYDMDNTLVVKTLRGNIAKAISKGVRPGYIKQLKLLYQFLAIFLKRINELY